jgi:hypothetical protein
MRGTFSGSGQNNTLNEVVLTVVLGTKELGHGTREDLLK